MKAFSHEEQKMLRQWSNENQSRKEESKNVPHTPSWLFPIATKLFRRTCLNLLIIMVVSVFVFAMQN